MLGMTPAGTAVVCCVAIVAALMLISHIVASMRDVRIARLTGEEPHRYRARRHVESTVRAPEEPPA
jgi:hypothetical protein